MRDRIVVATDLSEKSNIAVKKAIDISKKYDLWLEVLHVINPPLFEWAWGGEALDSRKDKEHLIKQKAEEISKKIEEELKRKHNKINVDIRVGNPSEEIIAYAKAKRANAIILGDVGEYGSLQELVLGTTTTNVIDRSSVPVLIARNTDSIEYKKILIPTDFSEDSKESIEYVSTLFPDAKLYILNVMEIPSELRLKYYGLEDKEIADLTEVHKIKNENDFNKFIESLDVKNPIEKVVAFGSIRARIIMEEGRDLSVDLIAVNAHNIANITSKIIGNIASEVIKKSKRDVLVYQTRRKES